MVIHAVHIVDTTRCLLSSFLVESVGIWPFPLGWTLLYSSARRRELCRISSLLCTCIPIAGRLVATCGSVGIPACFNPCYLVASSQLLTFRHYVTVRHRATSLETALTRSSAVVIVPFGDPSSLVSSCSKMHRVSRGTSSRLHSLMLTTRRSGLLGAAGYKVPCLRTAYAGLQPLGLRAATALQVRRFRPSSFSQPVDRHKLLLCLLQPL